MEKQITILNYVYAGGVRRNIQVAVGQKYEHSTTRFVENRDGALAGLPEDAQVKVSDDGDDIQIITREVITVTGIHKVGHESYEFTAVNKHGKETRYAAGFLHGPAFKPIGHLVVIDGEVYGGDFIDANDAMWTLGAKYGGTEYNRMRQAGLIRQLKHMTLVYTKIPGKITFDNDMRRPVFLSEPMPRIELDGEGNARVICEEIKIWESPLFFLNAAHRNLDGPTVLNGVNAPGDSKYFENRYPGVRSRISAAMVLWENDQYDFETL